MTRYRITLLDLKALCEHHSRMYKLYAAREFVGILSSLRWLIGAAHMISTCYHHLLADSA